MAFVAEDQLSGWYIVALPRTSPSIPPSPVIPGEVGTDCCPGRVPAPTHDRTVTGTGRVLRPTSWTGRFLYGDYWIEHGRRQPRCSRECGHRRHPDPTRTNEAFEASLRTLPGGTLLISHLIGMVMGILSGVWVGAGLDYLDASNTRSCM